MTPNFKTHPRDLQRSAMADRPPEQKAKAKGTKAIH